MQKAFKELRPEDLGTVGTGPTPAQAHLPGSTLSAPEDSQRGAESCLQGAFPWVTRTTTRLTPEDQLPEAAFPCAVRERPGALAPAPLRSADRGHRGPSHGSAGCRGLRDDP